MVVRDLVNAETVNVLCQAVAHNRLIIGATRGKDSAEALLQVSALGVPPAELAQSVIAVISQRLIRKLCETCKEAYTPPPQVLKQLRIPEGRVQAFYRPPNRIPRTEGAVRCVRRHWLPRPHCYL